DVQDDVGDVFHHAGDGADLMANALNLHACDGAAFKAGRQNAAQAVADRHAEAALVRLRDKLTVRVGERARIASHAVRQLQPTPSDTHILLSAGSLLVGRI